MSLIRITCPHCSFSRETDSARIPPDTRRVRCPQCGEAFPLPDVASSDTSSFPTAPLLPAAPESVPSAPAAILSRRYLNFVFTGNAREYFGIWIVNTLLTIVTLGIYSPWAKVRKRRYFYGNTLLDKARFEYFADPLVLLKGWLIGAALFLLYSFGSHVSPFIVPVIGLAFFLCVPWLIVRSRMFNARYSSHRNISFNFRPEYREAYTSFAWLPILTPFTLGLLLPYVLYRQRRFLVENGAFGRSFFAFDGKPGEFYAVGLKIVGLVVAFGIGGFLTVGGLMQVLVPMFGAAAIMSAVAVPLFVVAAYFLVGIYAYTALTNLTWNSTRLGRNRFHSTLRTRDMAWIYFSNAAAIAASLGLLAPWAAVRLARYRAANLALESRGGLDEFLAGARDEVGAAGEEIGEIFGVEVGF